MNGPEETEVSGIADTSCCGGTEAIIALTIIDLAATGVYNALAIVDMIPNNVSPNDVDVSTSFGGTLGVLNSNDLEIAKEVPSG